ncbi:hypothetical protein CJ231_02745 [Hoylesella buccalis]|uniref:DUF6531 domain-containing protein n=1 Tax=Hoylesella buccalis TaxID=28127 RepID=A0A2N6QSC1_9BACT|nr:DUF6531 domain-containing protein [Hoylesella buccalis]PMC24864.1 hypothetical protein CJ231_02745 [Hoylesella buccalis]
MLHFTQSLKKELSFYGFEPVNLVTGSVLYEGIDFFFPGALPLEWKRVYHSDSNFKGALGIGVATSIENQIKQSYGIPPKTIADIPDDAMMNVILL